MTRVGDAGREVPAAVMEQGGRDGRGTVNFKFTSPRRCDAFAIFMISRAVGNPQVPAKHFAHHEMAKRTRPLLAIITTTP